MSTTGLGSRPGEPLWHRIRTEWLGLNLGLALLIFLLSFYGEATFLSRINYLAYDATMGITARHHARDDIVIIALDDNSIEALGYWPWRRTIHAQLIARLSQARAVGLDILFDAPNPAYPDDDRLLAQAIERHGRVVLAQIADTQRRVLQSPLPILARAAHGIGRIDAPTDQDGAVRSIVLQRTLQPGEPLAHFSIAMAQAADAHAAVARANRHPDNTPTLISYTGPPKTFTTYPYVKVLNGEVPAATFDGKYVLIGSWASGLGDVLPTPFSRSNTAMAGVEVLANTLQNMLEDRWIHVPTRGTVAVLSLLPMLVVGLSLRRLSPRRSFALSAAALLGILLSNGLLMAYASVWIPPASSLIGVMLIYPLWSWRSQEASLRHIDAELQHLHDNHRLSIRTPGRPTSIDRSLSARIITLHQSIGLLSTTVRQREEALRFLSHDMRSPQNSILALTALQRHRGASQPEQAFLDNVEHYARDTLRLVDGFVHLARAEVVEMNCHEQDLIELVAGACDARWPQATQRSIVIDFTPAIDHAYAQVDSSLLTRAIGNLLDNAIHYSPEGSSIRCDVSRDETSWLIQVHDQGPGIAPEQIATLYEPFERLNQQTRGSPPGSGLGLAFVRTVMQRHGGSISCTSTPNQGSTFTARLPA
ncbi:CHASE2 domain-containing protein [Alcaligenaceae bacterium CGII-47]|nr:CHASE2 domain-containing protein [Alcaligenaceae bacterium CGII-47]